MERALTKILELARQNRAIETARVRSEAFSRAEMNALHSIVVELAEKAGISPEDFDAHHTHRLRWFLDQDLLSTGDSDPSFVERVATKELSEFIAVPEAFPGIFEPPHREE